MILFEKTASFNMQESHKSEKKAEGGKKKIIKKALFEQTRGIIQSNDAKIFESKNLQFISLNLSADYNWKNRE